jgi:hypothetical protein
LKRKGNVPVEATQELQALDVLEIVETLKNAPRATPGSAAGPVVTRKSLASNSSIAPVGLDLMPQRAIADEEVNATMQVRLPARRRRLGGIVIAAIAGCTLILVAAGVARVGHASSAPDPASSPALAALPATTAAATTPPGVDPSPATTPAPATTAAATASPTLSSTGTVRLDRPALPGHVWLDGKKLSSRSALVSCGTHQIKVGRGRTHSVDVPCGSEIGVSR